MRKNVRKLLAATIILGLSLSLTGCGLFGGGVPGNYLDAKQATQQVQSDLAGAVPSDQITNTTNVDTSPLVQCSIAGEYQWVGSSIITISGDSSPYTLNTYVVNYAKSQNLVYNEINDTETEVVSKTAGTFYTYADGATFKVVSTSVCFPFKPVAGKSY